MNKKRFGFILVFAVFWSAMVLAFDVFIVRTLIRQSLSWHYAITEGRIVGSEITTDHSEGTTYGAKIDYEFHVNGRLHQSDRVRYGQGSDSDGDWARETVQANPPRALRPVYYDASDPARCVLQRGIGGQDWFLCLFMTPFNVIMVFLWGLAGSRFRTPAPLGGAKTVTQGDRIRVYMKPMSRMAAAMLAFGLVTFAGVFVVGFSEGFSPRSPVYIWLTWGVAAGAAWGAAWKTGRPGSPYMVIDAGRGVLSLPQGQFNAVQNWAQWNAWKKAGMPALEIPIERIRGAAVRERITPSSDGNVTTYVTALQVDEKEPGSTREYDLGSWMFAEQAESFARWLREILGLRSGS